MTLEYSSFLKIQLLFLYGIYIYNNNVKKMVNRIISNSSDFMSVITDINNEYSGQIWWRGQNTLGKRIIPSLFRDPQYYENEKSRIQRFRSRAGIRHYRVPDYSDLGSWLFLMQHYRLPTRLLDWTESPLIACYFAIQDDQNDGEIIAIYPYEINQRFSGKSILFSPQDPLPSEVIEDAFKGKYDKDIVYAIRPIEVDIRMMTQLSVFTIHGSPESLEKIISDSHIIHRYTIPKECKSRISSDLKHLGIRESSLFPDLEHLAKEITETDFKHKKPVKTSQIENPTSKEIHSSEPST